MKQLECLAPAKLNLFLHVTGRRADGYHLLQSAFQLIDRCDRLHLSTREDGLICRSNEVPGVPEEHDLIIRAARLLQSHTQTKSGANLRLEKLIPMGAGLGGGSSDAASTLIGLNHLWQCGLSRQQLMDLGLQLGADVPFFIFGGNAFVEGIGEQLSPLMTPECWFVVIQPGVQIPTPQIFSSKELTRSSKPVKITDFASTAKNTLRNDLQAVACNLFPEVQSVIDWLKKFGNARMTGSGSCVFCEFSNEQDADNVVKQVPEQWLSWKAKSLNQHPMTDLLSF